jgi:hypothetical protein
MGIIIFLGFLPAIKEVAIRQTHITTPAEIKGVWVEINEKGSPARNLQTAINILTSHFTPKAAGRARKGVINAIRAKMQDKISIAGNIRAAIIFATGDIMESRSRANTSTGRVNTKDDTENITGVYM